jgi:hypothetical protein
MYRQYGCPGLERFCVEIKEASQGREESMEISTKLFSVCFLISMCVQALSTALSAC